MRITIDQLRSARGRTFLVVRKRRRTLKRSDARPIQRCARKLGKLRLFSNEALA